MVVKKISKVMFAAIILTAMSFVNLVYLGAPANAREVVCPDGSIKLIPDLSTADPCPALCTGGDTGDCPAKQAAAELSAKSSTGAIYKALYDNCLVSSSGGAGYSGACVVTQCKKFKSAQYRNACVKKGMGMFNCNPASSAYGACVLKMMKHCNDRVTDEQKMYCHAAAAYYVSGFHLTTNPKHATTTHTAAGKAYLALLGGGTLNEDGTVTPKGGGNPIGVGGAASAQPVPVDETASREEDDTLTAAELEASAQKVRDDLSKGKHGCGKDDEGKAFKTVFNFGCKPGVDNPILAVMFAIITFVTYGVGIIITLSIVISGIQYTTAQGNPGTVSKARMRIFNAVIALLLYIFAFAILNYLVPGGLIG